MFWTLFTIYLVIGIPSFLVLWACLKVGADADER